MAALPSPARFQAPSMCPAGTAFAQPTALVPQRLSGLLPQDPFPLRDLFASSALFKTQDLVRQALFYSKDARYTALSDFLVLWCCGVAEGGCRDVCVD